MLETVFLVFVFVLAWACALAALGLVVIGENESGLVIKRLGRSLPQGRLIAVDGEAGFQAALLPPGWHFPIWRFLAKVEKVPLIVVPAGEIGLVIANDGAAMPSSRMLAHEIKCDRFQDAEAFLRGGGERGRQLAFMTAGTYRINPSLFTVITARSAFVHGLDADQLRVTSVPPDSIGIVTTLDGAPIPAGDLAGPMIPGHDSFQRGAEFIAAGGRRGLQEEVLLSGSWNLNPWFASVQLQPMTEIPIGTVGVVVSFVGEEHLDLSGDDFTHGDLVGRGRKGVWQEPLLPGRYPINTAVMKVERVPTTNIVLNWATRTEAHKYDEKLAPIMVRSKDGFGFNLDVSQIIHVGMKNAPRVISRVGSMQNLVDHVLQPTVANYFRNSAQEVTVLEFLSNRSERQAQAYAAIRLATDAYDVECIDTLIGDIQPPAELMKTQTDKKIAEELRRTYDAQREAQVVRQHLERELAIANMQAEVVRSEQMVSIAEKNALAVAATARGEGERVKIAAEAEATSTTLRAQADATATRLAGDAQAEAYLKGVTSVGVDAYTAMELAGTFAAARTKLVPDVVVGAGGGLADGLLARMVLKGSTSSA
ncbi:MAG: SPFH domain-containing protein [Deltaproteobacteria bacterium]|nr:SPFH domain-containing protein [Deltaproteobacteria bacterium]